MSKILNIIRNFIVSIIDINFDIDHLGNKVYCDGDDHRFAPQFYTPKHGMVIFVEPNQRCCCGKITHEDYVRSLVE